MPKATITRSGFATAIREVSHKASAAVDPALARLCRWMGAPCCCSSASATRRPNPGWCGATPWNPEESYPSEMLSPVRQMVSGSRRWRELRHAWQRAD